VPTFQSADETLAGADRAGAAHALRLDHSASSQDSRVQFLVLHYTELGLAASLEVLTKGPVSAHYLVSDERPVQVYRLVDESRRAYHAGDSRWQGQGPLNAMSIGIEIVHPGFTNGPEGLVFVPYRPDQIDVVVALVRDIVRRHGIRPDRVVGHSDIAPQRKIDPGPLFPWDRLSAEGLASAADPARVAAVLPEFTARLPTMAWFQEQLAACGYEVPQHGRLDEATRRVLAAFQMRHRPCQHDGQPDAQTAARLSVLAGPPA
jgi:N-acetylmuramoyl-L-alanine amidase